MVFRTIRRAFLGAVAGLILGGVALGLSALDETTSHTGSPGPPLPQAPQGYAGSSPSQDFEIVELVKEVATPSVREGKTDRALAIIDTVGDEQLRDECLKWLAGAIADPSKLDEDAELPDEEEIQDDTEPGQDAVKSEPKSGQDAMKSEPKPVRSEKPADFTTALAVAEKIQDPVVRASALAEVGKAQALQPDPGQAAQAEATRGRALAALRLHFEPAKIRLGPIALRPMPRAILWPVGGTVAGIVVLVVVGSMLDAYGSTVGRSLAKEVGAARRPAP